MESVEPQMLGGARRGGRPWADRLAMVAWALCAVLAVAAAPAAARGQAAARCSGAWLVASGPCYAFGARPDCGVLVSTRVERYIKQGEWPWAVGPYVIPNMDCAGLMKLGINAGGWQADAEQRCARETAEIVANNLRGNFRARCGMPLLSPYLCAPGPQPNSVSFRLLFSVNVLRGVFNEFTGVDDQGCSGKYGQYLEREPSYAFCRHPANGPVSPWECLAHGDAVVTAPGLTAAEALESVGAASEDAAALCLTGEAAAVGAAADRYLSSQVQQSVQEWSHDDAYIRSFSRVR